MLGLRLGLGLGLLGLRLWRISSAQRRVCSNFRLLISDFYIRHFHQVDFQMQTFVAGTAVINVALVVDVQGLDQEGQGTA